MMTEKIRIALIKQNKNVRYEGKFINKETGEEI